MTTAQTLQEQLALLESETNKKVAATSKKLQQLRAEIKAQRAKELEQAAQEILATLARYNLTIEQALEVPATTSGLGKIRDYYSKNP